MCTEILKENFLCFFFLWNLSTAHIHFNYVLILVLNMDYRHHLETVWFSKCLSVLEKQLLFKPWFLSTASSYGLPALGHRAEG